jgi:hypothetical protein
MDESGHLQGLLAFFPGKEPPLAVGGPLSLTGLSGEELNILPLPGIEARLFVCPARNVVTIRIRLFIFPSFEL